MVALFSLQLTAKADDDKPITFEQLPAKSQQFIKKYFASKKVSLTKMESEFLGKEYKVMFVDGSSVSFIKSGDWKEVKCKPNEVPKGIIPSQILDYVAKNYPDVKINQIEKDKKQYEVKLSNKMELTFDTKFNLVNIDN